MIYPYKCNLCGFLWEVVKRVSEIDQQETCPSCAGDGVRYIASRQHFYGQKVEDSYFCPALGTIVKNKKHREKLAKEKGLIEVGNDDPVSNFDKYDKIKEEKSKARYREFFDPIEVKSA